MVDEIFKRYISRIIRNDCHFQFSFLLQKHFSHWNNNVKWIYKYSCCYGKLYSRTSKLPTKYIGKYFDFCRKSLLDNIIIGTFES